MPFREALRAWVRVAVHSFGGPAGQIAVLHRIVVEEKGWVGERRFLRALSFCMLLPGPEAQQLATYMGWTLHGTRGGLVAGGLFILPGFLSILALSLVYATWGDAPALEAAFRGLKPAVLAIVLHAVARLRSRALEGAGGVVIATLAFVAMFFLRVPFPVVILAAAAVGLLMAMTGRHELGSHSGEETRVYRGGGRPADPPVRSAAATARTVLVWLLVWLAPVGVLVAASGPDHVLAREAFFFSKTALVTFGGAYAVLAYVAQQAVEVYAWLAPGEMLDGLGMAETTPGPLIQVVQFVGFLGAYRDPGALHPLAAGVLGSVVTTWVTFAPCFLFIFAGAPYVEELERRPYLRGALSAITAAVIGVIVNLALWFGLHTLFAEVRTLRAGPASLDVPVWSTVDWLGIVLVAAALVALFRFRLGLFATIGGATAIGLLAWALGA